MGKYVVEIPDEDESFVDEESVITRFGDAYNVTGKIHNLEPYNYENILQSVSEKVWKFAAFLFLSDFEGGMSENDLSACFWGETNSSEIIKNHSYAEVLQKYNEWKSKQEEILVGDEVEFEDENQIACKGVLLEKNGLEWEYSFIFDDGRIEQFDKIYKTVKTGRHFDQIEEMLRRMKKEILP